MPARDARRFDGGDGATKRERARRRRLRPHAVAAKLTAIALLLGAAGTASAAGGTEIPSLRTEFSETRRINAGVFETTLSGTPLNYRDGGGAWRRIDNRLARQPDGSFDVRANAVDVEIPSSATGEVRFGDRGEEVAFSLLGADAEPAELTGGATAQYEEVARDADLSYEVEGRVLKETLTLASADAPTVYRFAVDAGDLTLRLGAAGDVAFVDGAGRQQLGFQAPWMRDADGEISRAARYELETAGGSDRVVLRLDAAWLRSPERSFPVVVDPTVYSGWEHVCEIRSGARSSTNLCEGSLSESWVGRDANGIVHRNIYELQDLSDAVPDYAQILDSWFAIYLNGQSPVEDSQVDLHHLTRGFGPGVTWNRSDSRTLWTRAGGDYDPQRLHRASTAAADPRDGWMAFDVTELSRGLVSGAVTSPNLLVKAADETRTHVDSFDAAEVKVRWHPRTGISPQYSYESFELSDGTRLSQNMASGNLVLSANDLDWRPDDGRSPTVRYFNSFGLLHGDFRGTFGDGTQGSFGTIRLEHHWLNDSYVFAGPSGLTGVFQRRADGGFTPPPGIDATLTELPDGTFTVQFADTLELWTFDSSGDLDQVRESDGYTVDATWERNGISTLSDSAGHSVTAAYDSGGELHTLTDENRAVHRYDYDGAERLVTYTNPTGGQTRYTYDGSNRLTRISLPDRRALKITYYGTTAHPSAITPVDAAGVDQPATTYDGDSDWTWSVRPATPRTVYFYDPNTLIVDLIQHGSAAAIAATGTIPSLHGRHTRGETPLTVDVSAAQAPDGIQLTELEVDGVEVDTVGAAPCDESTCPPRARETLVYDPAFDSEGIHEYRVNTVDGDDARTDGPLWRIAIDRTPPTAPSNFRALFWDDGSDETDIDWDAAVDPALPDATPGSGVHHYLYRVQREGGAWSAWEEIPGLGPVLIGSFDGEEIVVEARAVDGVGNVGAIATATLTSAPAADQGDDWELDGDPEGQPRPFGYLADEVEGEEEPDLGALAARDGIFDLRYCPRDSTMLPSPPGGPYGTMRIKLGKVGWTRNGDRFYRYHFHYQVRRAYWPRVSRTDMRVVFTRPDGDAHQDYYNSYNHRFDPNYRHYYAHFKRLTAKPGTSIIWRAGMRWVTPVQVGDIRYTGENYFGDCIASFLEG
jgi:YD repeat-containing protein